MPSAPLRPYLVLVVALALSLLALPTGASAARVDLRPATHDDRAGDVAGGLDVTSASFAQQDTQLQLSIETAKPWHAGGLSVAGRRRLCVEVSYGPGFASRERICVAPDKGRAVLRYAPVRADGTTGAETAIAAVVARPSLNTVLAQFPPGAVGLPDGRFLWRVSSRWTDTARCGAAAPACVDQVPNTGLLAGTAGLLVQPRCFGAASRDPSRRCVNPDLARVSIPTPAEAAITPNAFCKPPLNAGIVEPCAFGWLASAARPTVALIGDSHAGHWRGAVEVVADARRWGAYSLTRSGCPFTPHPTYQTPRKNRLCATWFRGVRRWFVAHPTVRTVYVGGHSLPDTAARRADYRRAWKSLPSSVRSIIVLRDSPRLERSQAGCVNRALRRRRPPGTACAHPRSRDLPPDGEAAAARGSGQRRVHVVDLSSFFCSASRCFPVIGGVLVQKDTEHLTRAFSTTLGPYLLRASRRYFPG